MAVETLTRRKPQRRESDSLDQVLNPIRRQLQTVTQRMLSQLANPVVRRVAYLITAGGKRLRPALVLLVGGCGDSPNYSALIDSAAAVELIHTATLIHDDIIDQAPLRRRQPSFHARWGTERAVLMGDYLYATAFALLTRLRLPYVSQVMAEVCQQLARGELREVEARYRLDLSETEYIEIIRDKTASLIGGCCQAGAYIGELSPESIGWLTDFGIHMGLAFQITDDCLDLTGRTEQLGKSIHTDLDKGVLSLPIIYLSESLSSRQRDQLFAPLHQGGQNPHFLKRVAQAAQDTGSIAKAQAKAQEFARSAKQAIAHSPVNGFAKACQQLAEYAISRRS